MIKPSIVLAIVLTSLSWAQSPPGPVSAASVWQTPSDFADQAHSACDKLSLPTKFADCVLDQMTKAGAPAAAVDFTRELYKNNGGQIGILAGFHKAGPVDIAWVKYPLSLTNGLLLVNGHPRLVNAEDLKLLDTKDMKSSFQFQDLKNQFPKVSVWPGDRDGKTWPNSQAGPNGGVQFVIGYPLRNGCQTCASAGYALFTWNFDPTGKFLGTTFLGMTPPPIQPAPAQSQ